VSLGVSGLTPALAPELDGQPSDSLWPRWLRPTIAGVAAAAIISGGWLSYRHFVKPVVLTVAVGSIDGGPSLISAVGAPDGVERPSIVVDTNTSAGIGTAGCARPTLPSFAAIPAARGCGRALRHGVVLLMAPRRAAIVSATFAIQRSALSEVRSTAHGRAEAVYPFDRARSCPRCLTSTARPASSDGSRPC
jgi:hypothetical protein